MSTLKEAPLAPYQDTPLSFSRGALIARTVQNRIAENYYESHSRQEDLPFKFIQLTASWQREMGHMSSTHIISMHPAYQRIIGMGPTIVPYILRQMSYDKAPWFWALKAITGENPIQPENKGKTDLMVLDWLKWGIGKGLL